MAADAQPTNRSPKRTHSSRPPPAPPQRPAPARSSPVPVPSSYGSISPFISPRSSLTLAQHSVRPSSFPPPSSSSELHTPARPLARVPSRPSLRPLLHIDFDAVAEQLSNFEGAPVTGEDLKNSFPAAQPSPAEPCASPAAHHGLHPSSGAATPAVPLSVHFAAPPDQSDDQSFVLKVCPLDDPSTSADAAASQNEFENGADPSKGFAMSIPVNPEPLDPPASSWPLEPDHYADEEAGLMEPLGIDLAPHSDMAMQHDTTAVVQRHGSKHDVEEHEVVVSMPDAASVGPNMGFIIPNYDSRENLTDLLVVVPPEPEEDAPATSGKLDDVSTSNATMTAESAKDAIEHFASLVPPMPAIVDLESTVEVHGSTKNATLTMNVRREVSVVGYLILAVALFSVASQGTAVKWLPSVDGMIAAAWLMQCQTVLMLPFAAFQLLTMDDEERWQWRQLSTIKLVIVASLSQVFWACGFFLAIDYTSMFHAWSLNNIHALTIVLIAVGQGMLSRKPMRVVTGGELLGARIAVGGLILMQVPNLLSMDVRSTCGDMIAALSSLGAIVYLNSCKELRQRVSLFVMMAPISALNSVTFSISSMLIAGTDFSVSDHGALGWMQSDRLLLGLYLGGVVGFLGTVSCIAALKYLPNVVVGSVQTMMPVVGTIVAVLMGAERLPDLWTTLGGAVLLYGVLVIADATRQSEVTVVLNEHVTADVRS